MIQIVIDSLIRASELALLAVGLTMVFGVVKFANVAHIEFATVGAYSALLVMATTGMGLLAAGLTSVVLVGAVAVLAYRSVFRRLLRSGPTIALIGSLALSILARSLIQTIAGARPRQLDVPLEQGILLGSAFITPSQLRLIALTFVVLAALFLLLKTTRLGRSIRAVATNPELAQAAGINSARVTDVVWFAGAALAALGGIFLAIDTQVAVEMGFDLLLPVFAVAIVGGLGSPAGAVIAALAIAFIETALLKVDFGSLVGGTPAFLPIDYRAAVGFVLIVVVLLYRPQGLFGGGARGA